MEITEPIDSNVYTSLFYTNSLVESVLPENLWSFYIPSVHRNPSISGEFHLRSNRFLGRLHLFGSGDPRGVSVRPRVWGSLESIRRLLSPGVVVVITVYGRLGVPDSTSPGRPERSFLSLRRLRPPWLVLVVDRLGEEMSRGTSVRTLTFYT